MIRNRRSTRKNVPSPSGIQRACDARLALHAANPTQIATAIAKRSRRTSSHHDREGATAAAQNTNVAVARPTHARNQSEVNSELRYASPSKIFAVTAKSPA